MSEKLNLPSDPFVISLCAQRFFNQNLLLALVKSGALSKDEAGAIAGKTAIEIRDYQVQARAERFSAKLADNFESLSSDILGLKPLPPDPKR